MVDRPGRRGAGGRHRPRDDRGRPRAAVERSRRAGRPHRRDPRIPGCDRARGADRPGDARDRHRAGGHDDAHRAVPRLHADRDDRLRQRRPRGLARARGAEPLGGRARRAPRPAVARGAARGGRRARRGRPPALGLVGGGRGDPRRRAPPLRRPVQAAPHRLRRRALPDPRARRSRRARRRASPSCSRRSPASGRTSCSRTSSCSSTTTRARRGAPRPARRAAPARAGGGRLHRHAVGARRRARASARTPGCCPPPSRTTCTRSRAGWSPSCSRGAGPPRSYAAGTLRERLGLGAAPRTATPHEQAPDPPRRPLPGREQHDGVERPGVRQPHRLRVLRAPGPDRRAREVRLLLPRRGPEPARARRPRARPRRRGAPRVVHDPRRARRGDRAHRPHGDAHRDVPRALRARPRAGHPRPPLRRPRGVEPRDVDRRAHRPQLQPRRLPRLRGPLRARRASCSSRPRSSGTPGRRATSSPTPRPAGSSHGPTPGRSPSTASRSTSRDASRCRGPRRAARSSSRRATPTTAASSPPSTPTASSRATAAWRPGARSTRTSSRGCRPTGASPASC